MSALTEQYEKLIDSMMDEDRPTAQIDQNIAAFKVAARRAGIDLDDPVALDHFYHAAAVLTALYLQDVAATCDKEPCMVSAIGHIRRAAAYIGGHLQEMRKLAAQPSYLISEDEAALREMGLWEDDLSED